MARHSELPWEFDFEMDVVLDSSGDVIYDLTSSALSGAVDTANAEFIVRSVNSHDDLVGSVKLLMSWIDNWGPEFMSEAEWRVDRATIEATLAAVEKP